MVSCSYSSVILQCLIYFRFVISVVVLDENHINLCLVLQFIVLPRALSDESRIGQGCCKFNVEIIH